MFLPLRISIHRPFANHNCIHQSPPCLRARLYGDHTESRDWAVMGVKDGTARYATCIYPGSTANTKHANDSSATKDSPRARIACAMIVPVRIEGHQIQPDAQYPANHQLLIPRQQGAQEYPCRKVYRVRWNTAIQRHYPSRLPWTRASCLGYRP